MRRTMITARTVCFVYCVLLLGTAHAYNSTTQPKNVSSPNQEPTETNPTTDKSIGPTIAAVESTSIQTSTINQKGSNCTSPHPGPPHCIFFLPDENTLTLVLVALTVACFILLLTTLICACQVCHLKTIIVRFQSHHHEDLHSVRKTRESSCRDDGQVEGHPAETCLMLSEVTTAQEERNEGESVQPSTEPPVEGLNGDIIQEEGNGKSGEGESQKPEDGVESKELNAEAPENTGV